MEVIGDEEIDLIKEFFQVRIKSPITAEDEFCGYQRDINREIPVEDMEVRETIE